MYFIFLLLLLSFLRFVVLFSFPFLLFPTLVIRVTEFSAKGTFGFSQIIAIGSIVILSSAMFAIHTSIRVTSVPL